MGWPTSYPPYEPASLDDGVNQKSAEQPVEPRRTPGPEVRGVEHHAERDMAAHSETQGENDPLAQHGVSGSPGGLMKQDWSEDYTAGVLADSISVAVIRLER